MKLVRLKTENFRNLEGEIIEFSDGVNVLYGDNAQGKTNTLEAIYIFATGKSFRTRSEKDFIDHDQSYARAEIEFEKAGSLRTMSVAYMANGARAIRGMQLEGISVDKVSEFLGNFRAVLFTPDHLELIKGAPEERRRLVDMALCQIKPRYVKSLNEYAKILSQRNNYLKQTKFSGREADRDYLDVLNMQLASAGAVITRQRGLYCEKLSQLAGEKYKELTCGDEMLYAKYISKPCGDIFDEEKCKEALYNAYKKNMAHDIELAKTSVGPHHDEIAIYLMKKADDGEFLSSVCNLSTESLAECAARTFGSQGQQRSAVLAIKLSEGEIIKEKCGEYPVFLFDDLFSELDDKRRKRLSEMFESKQCIITCCDKAAIPKSDKINIISVEDGRYKSYGDEI